MAAAVPLVVVSEEGSGGDDGFSLDPAGVSLLQGLTGDIHVVAIGGAQRTGKSFLLSLLTSRGHDDVAARGSGFVVGNTQRACTVGIWVLKTVDMDGKTTVWLDTEGFASTSRSASYDARIFALALLLSSCFIYNSRWIRWLSFTNAMRRTNQSLHSFQRFFASRFSCVVFMAPLFSRQLTSCGSSRGGST